jgi:hypothetical protein
MVKYLGADFMKSLLEIVEFKEPDPSIADGDALPEAGRGGKGRGKKRKAAAPP